MKAKCVVELVKKCSDPKESFSDKKMFQVGTFKLAGKSREFTIRPSLKNLYSPLLFQRNSLDIINSF